MKRRRLFDSVENVLLEQAGVRWWEKAMARAVALADLRLVFTLAAADQCIQNRLYRLAGAPDVAEPAAQRRHNAGPAASDELALDLFPVVLWDEGIRPVTGSTMKPVKDVSKRGRRYNERARNRGSGVTHLAAQRLRRETGPRDARVIPLSASGLAGALGPEGNLVVHSLVALVRWANKPRLLAPMIFDIFRNEPSHIASKNLRNVVAGIFRSTT